MIFDSVYIQNCVLWWVDDWCRYQGIEYIIVGDGEVIIGQIFNGQFVVMVFDCQFFDFFFDVCYVEGIDIMQYWCYQVVWCRNCYVDVEIVVVNYVIVVDRCVYFWVMFQGFNYCFYVEGYKVQMDVVVFFKCFIVLFMQIYNWFYVDFVECGQYGGGVFCFQQMFCYMFMQVSYWDMFFIMCSQSWLCCWSSCCWSRFFCWGFCQMFFYIFMSQMIIYIGVFNGVGVEIVFSQQVMDCWV